MRSSIVWIEWQVIAAIRSGDPWTAEARGGVERPRTAGGEPSGRSRCWRASALPIATGDTPWVTILCGHGGSARGRLPPCVISAFPVPLPFLSSDAKKKKTNRRHTPRTHCAIESTPPAEQARWERLIAAMAREVGWRRGQGSRRRAPVESGASKRWRGVA